MRLRKIRYALFSGEVQVMRCRCDDAGAVFEDLGLQEECCGCKYDDVFLVSVFHLKCKE